MTSSNPSFGPSFGPAVFVGVVAAAGFYCLYQGARGLLSGATSVFSGTSVGQTNETAERTTQTAQRQIVNQATSTTTTTTTTTSSQNLTTSAKKSVVHLRPSISPDFNRRSLISTAMPSVQHASSQLSVLSNTSSSQALATSTQSSGALGAYLGPQVIVSARKGTTEIKFNIDLNQFKLASLLKPGTNFKVSWFTSDELLPETARLLLTGEENSEEAAQEENSLQPEAPGNVLNIKITTEDGVSCVGQIPLTPKMFPDAAATEEDDSAQWNLKLSMLENSLPDDVQYSIQEEKTDVSLTEDYSEDASFDADNAASSSNSLTSSRSSSSMLKSIKNKEKHIPRQGKKSHKSRSTSASTSERSTSSKRKEKSHKTHSNEPKTITVKVKKKESEKSDKSRDTKTTTSTYSSSSSRSSSTTAYSSATLNSLFGSRTKKKD